MYNEHQWQRLLATNAKNPLWCNDSNLQACRLVCANSHLSTVLIMQWTGLPKFHQSLLVSCQITTYLTQRPTDFKTGLPPDIYPQMWQKIKPKNHAIGVYHIPSCNYSCRPVALYTVVQVKHDWDAPPRSPIYTALAYIVMSSLQYHALHPAHLFSHCHRWQTVWIGSLLEA